MGSFLAQVLTQQQHTVLQATGPECDRRGFYLAGGTAVAIRLRQIAG